jgi:hypothetical protein
MTISDRAEAGEGSAGRASGAGCLCVGVVILAKTVTTEMGGGLPGGDVEDYLVPIYKTEAMFVLPILSPTYPTRIWAKIESDAFKERFGQSAVIPIKLSTVQEGFFNDYMRYGYLALDMSGDIEAQLINIADTLGRRMLDERAQSANEAVAAEA